MQGKIKGNKKKWKKKYMVDKCIRDDDVEDIEIINLLKVKEEERKISCDDDMNVKMYKDCEKIIL